MNPAKIKSEISNIKKLCNKILSELDGQVVNIVLKECNTNKVCAAYSILEVGGVITYKEFVYAKEHHKTYEAISRCLLSITESLNPVNFADNKTELNVYCDIPLNDLLKTDCGPDAVGFIMGLGNLTKVTTFPVKRYGRLDELNDYIERTIGEYETDNYLSEGNKGAA